jgi:hypothetical protein
VPNAEGNIAVKSSRLKYIDHEYGKCIACPDVGKISAFDVASSRPPKSCIDM